MSGLANATTIGRPVRLGHFRCYFDKSSNKCELDHTGERGGRENLPGRLFWDLPVYTLSDAPRALPPRRRCPARWGSLQVGRGSIAPARFMPLHATSTTTAVTAPVVVRSGLRAGGRRIRTPGPSFAKLAKFAASRDLSASRTTARPRCHSPAVASLPICRRRHEAANLSREQAGEFDRRRVLILRADDLQAHR
jgi:hypothetical protein